MRRRLNLKKTGRFRYSGLLGVLCTFLLIAAILFVERSGIHYASTRIEQAYIDTEISLRAEQVQKQLPENCLLLFNSQDTDSNNAVQEMKHILLDMKVGYVPIDVSQQDDYSFDEYETVVVVLSNISPLKDNVLELADWVKGGGNALFSMTLEQDTYCRLLEPKLGIIASDYRNSLIESYYPDEEFMLGGGQIYPIPDPFESSRSVALSEKAKVHVWSGDEKRIPLIWENPYGEGKFVVINIGTYEKVVRGFYAAAYSLLTDCVVYPVINGAAFYFDDFPSPILNANKDEIRQDYAISMQEFYHNIWWPDMLKLAAQHHIKYTGALIENYEDITTGIVEHPEDTQVFQYFGNTLLRQQGEIGYHGYNHQPFCLKNVKYPDFLQYKTWEDMASMETAMTELISFANDMFPDTQKSVYVPPSNILSREGREMISRKSPEIRTIASHYLSSELIYQQEFEVAEDGIVEQPRITSGAIIDDYTMLTALSELNMHFVNNHFVHPNDLVNEDHGVKDGWAGLYNNLERYMNWLYTSAPKIDPLTASQLSGRIQRFAAVTVDKTVTENAIQLQLGNLYDDAYFMVRFNNGQPEEVAGGTLEHLTGNLYLLHVNSEDVTINISR